MTQNKKMIETSKPFLTGAPTDENTLRQSLKFFANLFICMFMTFLVCSMTGFKSVVLRVIVNLVIEAMILLIFFAKGTDLGTDAVSRGEILYQHIQKGQEATKAEKQIPFNKLKGYLIGAAGTLLFFMAAMILAFTTEKQMTGAGGLPSWMEAFMRRAEVGDALVSYTISDPLTLTDIVRIIVRLLLMPFVSMIGASNTEGIMILERLSPVLVLLPAVAYGTGYLQGPAKRKQIHTEIAKNDRKRISRERKEKKARSRQEYRGPEQLN